MPGEDGRETMTIALPFGREYIPVTLPAENIAAVAAPDDFPALEDPEREISSSLLHPVGSPEICRIVGPGAKVLIICDDNTRATPAEIMVGALLKELGNCGIPDRDVAILMALGTHMGTSVAEKVYRIVSEGISPEKAAKLGFLRARTVEEALDLAWMRHGSHARVTILPYAPDTLPVILSPFQS